MSVKSSVGTVADWITRSYLLWVVLFLVALGVVLWVWHKPKVDLAVDAAKYQLGMGEHIFSPTTDWDATWESVPVQVPAPTEVPEPPAPPTGEQTEAAAKGWVRDTCSPWPHCEWTTGD